VFNQAPGHEGVLGSEGITLRILSLCTRWRWVLSFTLRPLYPTIGAWVGPRASLDSKWKLLVKFKGEVVPVLN